MADFSSDISSMAGSSPKGIAAILLLRMYEKYFDYMAGNENVNLERMTAALLISCPEDEKREAMWNEFLDQRNKGASDVTASVYAVGKWYSYMSDAMGLNEKSTGGW